ncbi:MAG: tabA [Paenibacillus sp.]|jgi:biofilm protein TabA|nr:tabA [Paenibacillus sp.]
MIIGKLSELEQTRKLYGAGLNRAFDFMLSTDFAQAADGRVDIIGDQMYGTVSIAQTATIADRKWEAHAQFADIHLLLEGEEELLAYAPASANNVPTEDHLDTKDYALFEQAEGGSEVRLAAGMFVVFLAGELHKPSCSRNGDTQIRKLVMKIDHALLL